MNNGVKSECVDTDEGNGILLCYLRSEVTILYEHHCTVTDYGIASFVNKNLRRCFYEKRNRYKCLGQKRTY